MNTKLTLRLDESLIARAKEYARREGRSISQIVSDYFGAIQKRGEMPIKKIGPITSKLRGCLKGVKVNESDFRRHLERKYL